MLGTEAACGARGGTGRGSSASDGSSRPLAGTTRFLPAPEAPYRPEESTRTCPLCERTCPERRLERHHLQTRRKDRFDVELICADCHGSIHALFDHAALRDPTRALDTIEGLLAEPTFARHVAFLRRADPNGSVRTRSRRR